MGLREVDRRVIRALAALLALGAAGCGGADAASPPAAPAATPTPGTLRVPLTDMGGSNYLAFAGGLYPGGDTAPAAHAAEGLRRANAVRPLDVAGRPDAAGRYVLLSIGMSNTTQEFCSSGSGLPCDPWTFMGQAAADGSVNHTSLALVNGATGGRTSSFWDAASDADYDRIRDTRLSPQGLSELQVQIVWLKVANASPTVSLPSPQSDAYMLVRQMGDIARALRTRYPNLQQVFVSSRIYAGYATTALNPEPYAYESGFAVKWLIEAQIRQMATGAADARAGDLAYERAPWLAWGPYLWADGVSPRSDGLVWERADLVADGTHPSRSGQTKVGSMLLAFFKQSPQARCWFAAGETCP